MTDVLITPGSRKIEFFNSGDSIDATISTDVDGNLSIQNPGGDIAIGDVTGDVFVGDGINNVNLVFEQDGIIYATSGNTLTVGDSAAALVLKGSSVSLTDGDFTVDTNTFHVDAATNQVGIGTTSPSYKVEIEAAGDNRVHVHGLGGSGSYARFTAFNDSDGAGHAGAIAELASLGWGNAYVRIADNYLRQTSGRFEIQHDTRNTYFNGSGNIGLGVATPTYKLDVSGTGRFTGDLTLNANLDMQDNDIIKLGTGDDLQIYHDGTSNYIKSSSGQDLIINRGGTGSQKVIIATGGSTAGGTTLEFQPIAGYGACIINNTANSTSTPLQIQIGGTSKLQIDPNDVKVVNSRLNVYGGSSGYNNWNASSLVKVENSGNTYMEFHTPSSAFTGMLFTDNTAAAGQIIFGHNGTATANTLHIQAYEDIHFRASQTNGILAGVARLAIQGSTGRIGIGTINPNVALDVSSQTDALGLPKGTTAERPSSPVVGQFRYNTETPGAEIYDGTTWGAVGGGGGVTAKRTIAYSILYGRL